MSIPLEIAPLLNWNQQALLWLNGDAGACWDQIFWLASGKLIWIPLYVFILWLVYRKLGLRQMVVFLLLLGLLVGISDQICNFFKYYLASPRPTHDPQISVWVHRVNGYVGGQSGTISAHAAISFCIAFMSSKILKNKWFSMGIYGWALLVAYSRIYLGVHFPLDILLGVLTGTLVGWGGFCALDPYLLRLVKRRLPHTSPTSPTSSPSKPTSSDSRT